LSNSKLFTIYGGIILKIISPEQYVFYYLWRNYFENYFARTNVFYIFVAK